MPYDGQVLVTSKGFSSKGLAIVESESNLYWRAVRAHDVADVAPVLLRQRLYRIQQLRRVLLADLPVSRLHLARHLLVLRSHPTTSQKINPGSG